MGDNKKSNLKSPGKKPATPTKQDAKPKSPVKNKSSTPSKIDDKSNTKNKKTPIKESTIDSKTLVKTGSKSSIKPSDVKSPVKNTTTDKKTPISNKKSLNKDSNVENKTPVKKSSPGKSSTDSKTTNSVTKKPKTVFSLPISRVRLIMKTARYAEAISPDAVHLTLIAAELFVKYLMQGVHADSLPNKKKTIDYNALASYVNSEEEEHLEFLRVLIPHKISVAKYKKLMAENANSEGLDFLVSETEESGSEEESEEDSSGEDEDSDIEEIPTPQKTKTTTPQKATTPQKSTPQKPVPQKSPSQKPTPKKSVTKKGGKVETVDLCESSNSSDEDVKVVVL